MRSCIRPIFKTAMEACSFSRPCSACIRFCKSSSPMADIKGRSFKRLWPKRFRTSKSKSSNGRITPKASRFSPSVGLSNAPSPGSTDAGDWPRTLKTSPAMPWHSCVSPRSASRSENFVINNQLSGPTLSALSPDAARLERVLARARKGYQELSGVSGIWRLDCHVLPTEKEAFGFRDGISHPAVEGSGIPGSNPIEQPIKAGEFLLGYPNELGELP